MIRFFTSFLAVQQNTANETKYKLMYTFIQRFFNIFGKGTQKNTKHFYIFFSIEDDKLGYDSKTDKICGSLPSAILYLLK